MWNCCWPVFYGCGIVVKNSRRLTLNTEKKKASLYMKIILLFLEIETAVNEHFNS